MKRIFIVLAAIFHLVLLNQTVAAQTPQIGVYFDDAGTSQATTMATGPFSFWLVISDLPNDGIKGIDLEILVDPTQISLQGHEILSNSCLDFESLPDIESGCLSPVFGNTVAFVRVDATLLSDSYNVAIELGPRSGNSEIFFLDGNDDLVTLSLVSHSGYPAGSAVIKPAEPTIVGLYFDDLGSQNQLTMTPGLVSLWVVLSDLPANGIKGIEFDLLYDQSEALVIGYEYLPTSCLDFGSLPSFLYTCVQTTIATDLAYLRLDLDIIAEYGDVNIGIGPRSATGKLQIEDGDGVAVPLKKAFNYPDPLGSATIHLPREPGLVGIYFDQAGSSNEMSLAPGPFSFWVVMDYVPAGGYKGIYFDLLVDPSEISLLGELVSFPTCSNNDILPSVGISCTFPINNSPLVVMRVDAELLTTAGDVEIGIGPKTSGGAFAYSDANFNFHSLERAEHGAYSPGSAVLNPVVEPVFIGAYFDEAGLSQSTTMPTPGLFSFWVVIDNPPPAGFSGAEFDVLVDPAQVNILSHQNLGAGCLDFSSPPAYKISCPSPNFNESIAVIRLFADLLTSANEVVIGVGPNSNSQDLVMFDGDALEIGLALADNGNYPAGAAVINPSASSVADGLIGRAHLTLSSGAPNPFGPRTSFAFNLKNPGEVTIEVYDLRGRRVKQISTSHMAAGPGSFIWDGRDDRGMRQSAGVYFVRLRAGNFEAKQRVTLLR